MSFALPTTTRSGARRWLDPAVQDVARKIHDGDPTVGWSGDERLGLYLATEGPYAGQWELVRFPEDGSPEMIVARAKPGVDIRTLPAHLAYHDMRRKGAVEDIERDAMVAEAAHKAMEKQQVGEAVDTWLSRATRHAGPAPQRAS
jgi:hypothetical protein